jgi:N utilization substance protein A
VVVNEDQLSLAIGKRGQNVRLAARLTGWDVDILTPAEFQAGVQRVETMLKSIEGFPQDQVDKVIALGLIDVRDIEEVGSGPLMEELGVPEEVADVAVERAAAEARLVAIEQEKKKADMARAKAAGGASGPNDLAALMGLKGIDGLAGIPATEPRAVQEGAAVDSAVAEGGADGTDRMPGALESSDGGAPEVTVHSERGMTANRDDLSPEEQAVNVASPAVDEGEARVKSEDDDAAALAEGRVEPPVTGRE